MATVKSEVMQWIDKQLAQDESLRQLVEERLHEMRLEQQLATLREARGLSQTQVANIVGVSQPAIAKLESGKVKNLQVKTLVRLAIALGARITIEITPQDQQSESKDTHPTKAVARPPRRTTARVRHPSTHSQRHLTSHALDNIAAAGKSPGKPNR